WARVSSPLDLSSPAVAASRPGAANLVLRPRALQPGFHRFRLTAEDPAFADSAQPVSAYAEAPVYVNAPPAGGSCSLSPAAGEALSTRLRVACSGWADLQGYEPLAYEFSYWQEDPRADADGDADAQQQPQPQLLRPLQPYADYSTLLPAGRLRLRAR